ncbi:hypothetical protein BJ170DRAFT_674239 [Xylariales sp. AK1849]|nr:hypothetical protein BJ170DRAFT_674239 [Xylariales sp. AK1849]
MPIFRGIEVSVVASTEAKKLTEYPHPDGSSVRLVSADDVHNGDDLSPRPSDTSVLSVGDPTHQKKVNPRISVYIPSMPGEQFWLKYNVIRSPNPAAYLYFKMLMNGRLITSWGVLTDDEKNDPPQRQISGTVVRALYEPGERWRNRGMVGIETRYFHFMPGLEKRSVAEDGGLIEVQVFRSKGRRRRAPNMAEFRHQERYGIASPSGGLVENPQDATYYDWLLIDPKDAPYASFCFHYRSMKHLLQLSLIPQSDSRLLIPRNDSEFFDGQGTLIATQATPDQQSPSTPQFAFGVESLDTTVFNEGGREDANVAPEPKTPDKYRLQSPPELATVSTSQVIQQPSRASRDAATLVILDRPLPDPPGPASSKRSSRSSLRSACPSLTPSLAQYVDNGNFCDDKISIGMALTVIPLVPSMVELPSGKLHNGDDDSISDYDNSPPSSVASREPSSPQTYLSTTGSVLERHIAQFTSPMVQPSPRRTRARLPISASERTLLADSVNPQFDMLSLSESEWMRRTPSPVERKPLSRIWSPRLEKKPTELLLKDNRKSRYSDIGPLIPSWAFGKGITEGEPAHSADSPERITDRVSNESGIPQLRAEEKRCPLEADLNPSVERSHNNTWESCRELACQEYEVGERPVGNWI